MSIKLFAHQLDAVQKLKTGSILCGGVGSGKTLTSVAYFHKKVCGGIILENGTVELGNLKTPRDLYIITTAKKRDSLDWEKECAQFGWSKDAACSIGGVRICVDSWNNIEKYVGTTGAFFIFDEQKVIGSGVWVRSFLKIAAKNEWLLLSATPGDKWEDYIPVFLANGFYKNRTAFFQRHVVLRFGSRYPKVDHYVEIALLEKHKKEITVLMPYKKHTTDHYIPYIVPFDEDLFETVHKLRWHVYEDRPIKDVTEWFFTMRRVVNSDTSRLDAVLELIKTHPRLIVFYNFNYELSLLRSIKGVALAEWNGQRHDPIPETDSWIYLVQYNAGAEGWNCTTTNAVVFFSQNYSYKIRTQAAGRIDRLDTPFNELYYYSLLSNSWIDKMISKSFQLKKNFNERPYKKFLEVA